MLDELRLSKTLGRPRSLLAITLVLAGLLAGARGAVALEVEQIVSARGIKAWLVEEHSVPLVAIKFAFMGGSAQDPTGKEGLAGMMSDLLTEGAGDMPARIYKEKLSGLGSRLSTSSGKDAIYGGLETLSKRFAPSAELLRQVLVSPRFDVSSIELVRGQRTTDLARSANDPTRLALDRWYAEAFPGHPYARPVDGTPKSIARNHGR